LSLLAPIFPDKNGFSDFLQFRLDRRYTDFEGPTDALPRVIRNVVNEANSRLWWREVLREARNVVPGDDGLARFAAQFGLAPELVTTSTGGSVTLSEPQLELKIKASQSTYDIVAWRRKVGEIEGRVCRVECPAGVALGTGFLIGPNAVITNFHVVEAATDHAEIRLRFDYKVLDDGVAVSKGLVYNLASDWNYDSSRYSPEDKKVTPQDPNPDELDYAILRVDGNPGNDFVGGKTDDPNAIPRGWISPIATSYDFLAQKAIYIVEHPDGMPMQIAIDSNAVVGINGNQTRVRYTTTTQPGSSGSPCFGPDWEWVALHHSGDPKYAVGGKPEFNQGIPVAAIKALLQRRNKLAPIGGRI